MGFHCLSLVARRRGRVAMRSGVAKNEHMKRTNAQYGRTGPFLSTQRRNLAIPQPRAVDAMLHVAKQGLSLPRLAPEIDGDKCPTCASNLWAKAGVPERVVREPQGDQLAKQSLKSAMIKLHADGAGASAMTMVRAQITAARRASRPAC